LHMRPPPPTADRGGRVGRPRRIVGRRVRCADASTHPVALGLSFCYTGICLGRLYG